MTDLLLISNVLSGGSSGKDRPWKDFFSKKKRAGAADEAKEIGKQGGEESNGSGGGRRPETQVGKSSGNGGYRRPATQVRKSSVPCLAPEFDGLNIFETLVSH